jgi:uncharacterized cupin superfamily protein
MKPVINIDELEYTEWGERSFQQRYAEISSRIGAQDLGYNLTIVPPGKKACPFHNHRANEEMFFVLAGSGVLRFGDQRYPIKAHDVIACPPGGPEVAHQIINTGEVELSYLALSTMKKIEIGEFPDSNKIMSYVGTSMNKELKHVARADQPVDYFDGEE